MNIFQNKGYTIVLYRYEKGEEQKRKLKVCSLSKRRLATLSPGMERLNTVKGSLSSVTWLVGIVKTSRIF